MDKTKTSVYHSSYSDIALISLTHLLVVQWQSRQLWESNMSWVLTWQVHSVQSSTVHSSLFLCTIPLWIQTPAWMPMWFMSTFFSSVWKTKQSLGFDYVECDNLQHVHYTSSIYSLIDLHAATFLLTTLRSSLDSSCTTTPRPFSSLNMPASSSQENPQIICRST